MHYKRVECDKRALIKISITALSHSNICILYLYIPCIEGSADLVWYCATETTKNTTFTEFALNEESSVSKAAIIWFLEWRMVPIKMAGLWAY